jgi:hypothetical protein
VDTPADNFDTRDHGGRHPQDRVLRGYGFTIYARPAKGPAVWVKGGTLYTAGEALAEARAALAAVWDGRPAAGEGRQ